MHLWLLQMKHLNSVVNLHLLNVYQNTFNLISRISFLSISLVVYRYFYHVWLKTVTDSPRMIWYESIWIDFRSIWSRKTAIVHGNLPKITRIFKTSTFSKRTLSSTSHSGKNIPGFKEPSPWLLDLGTIEEILNVQSRRGSEKRIMEIVIEARFEGDPPNNWMTKMLIQKMSYVTKFKRKFWKVNIRL